MSVKLKHNISSWNRLKVNYWGIPKCGNTSVKYALAQASKLAVQQIDEVCAWVHNEKLTQYITPARAKENGYTNFTVVRDPVERFISMYKDVKRRAMLGNRIGKNKSINNFLDHLENTVDEKRDVHFRSQCYFIADSEQVIPNVLTYAEIEELIGIEVKHLNVIDKEYTLDTEQKDRVYKIFEKDYRLLGFKHE